MPLKQDPGSSFDVLSSIHTIVYNRTFNPDNMVVAVYTPTSFQYSPGKYVSFTTASNDNLRFTPTTFYLNNLGFPYKESGSAPPTDGIIRLKTEVSDDPRAIGNDFSINIPNPSCTIFCSSG